MNSRLALDMGDGLMDRVQFRDWVSNIDELTAAKCREVAAVMPDPPEGETSLAAIELRIDEERRCPHCGSGGTLSPGKAHGLCRYRCKSCGRTFDPLTGTARSWLHRKERWLSFATALPRHRHQVSRQLSEVVPSRRARQASIAKSLPRGGQRQTSLRFAN